MKIWVEKDGYDYILTQDDNGWDEPVEVTEEWWKNYLNTQRSYYLMQHYAATLAGYEDDEDPFYGEADCD